MENLRRSVRHLTLGAVAGLALAATACEPSAPSEGLRAVAIPADFTFATTKQAVISVSVSPELVAESAVLEVKRVDGATVYWGSVSPDAPAEVSTLLPKHHEAVQVDLRRQGMPPISQTVSLQDGAAAHRFE